MENVASRDPPRKTYRAADLAREFGGSPSWWRHMVKTGEIPGCKLGHRTLVIFADDLAEFFARKRQVRCPLS